jgi:hypothetical protein
LFSSFRVLYLLLSKFFELCFHSVQLNKYTIVPARASPSLPPVIPGARFHSNAPRFNALTPTLPNLNLNPILRCSPCQVTYYFSSSLCLYKLVVVVSPRLPSSVFRCPPSIFRRLYSTRYLNPSCTYVAGHTIHDSSSPPLAALRYYSCSENAIQYLRQLSFQLSCLRVEGPLDAPRRAVFDQATCRTSLTARIDELDSEWVTVLKYFQRPCTLNPVHTSCIRESNIYSDADKNGNRHSNGYGRLPHPSDTISRL